MASRSRPTQQLVASRSWPEHQQAANQCRLVQELATILDQQVLQLVVTLVRRMGG